MLTQEHLPSSSSSCLRPSQDPSTQLHRCLLCLPEQRADLAVALLHGPLPGPCYGALLEAFSLTLNPLIDFLRLPA